MTRRLPAGLRPEDSCVLNELSHGEELLFFYHDDDAKDDIPGEASDIAAGFETLNAYYVGNDRAAAVGIEHLRVCYEDVRNGTCRSKCNEVSVQDFNYLGKVDPRMLRSTLFR